MRAGRFRIVRLEVRALSVPLLEPFVIATARVERTPNVLVEAEVVDLRTGEQAVGLGEAATLWPVTRETQQEALEVLASRPPEQTLSEDDLPGLASFLGDGRAPACSGVETALVDALARLSGVPLRRWLAPGEIDALVTDVTIPIAVPEHVGDLARRWRSRGFTSLKVKIDGDLDRAARSLGALHRVAPDATVRIDANAALSASETLALAREVDRMGLVVECWEQPCGKEALDELAKVASTLDAPVIADESCASLADLDRLVAAKAADGINLKLAKSGGPLTCLALGRRARGLGLKLMFGAMVETRLGITAAANVAAALGGADFVDLDTALLLAADPFIGGHSMHGSILSLAAGSGLAVKRAG